MPWQERLAIVLAHFLWQGAVVAGLLSILTGLFKVGRPGFRYAASLFGLLTMAACPVVTWCFLQASLSNRISEPTATHLANRAMAIQLGNAVETAVSSRQIAELRTSLSRVSTVNQALQGELIRPAESSRNVFDGDNPIASWVVAVWIAGVNLLSLRLAVGMAGTWIWRHRVDVPSQDLVKGVHRLCAVMSMSVPCIRLSRCVNEALVVGLFRPMMLLPVAWVTELPADMLEAVVAHELAHLRRHDLWIKLGQRVVETLLFYHPAVWWLSRRLCLERELCCDAVAVRSTGNPVRYAETLERIARLVRIHPIPGLALGIKPSDGVLLRRVQHVLGCAQPQPISGVWFAALATLSVVAALILGMFRDTQAESTPQEPANGLALPVMPARPEKSIDESQPARATLEFPQARIEESKTTAHETPTADDIAAQPPKPAFEFDRPVAKVVIEGNRTIPDSEIVKYINIRAGQSVTLTEIKEDVDALVRSRWFAHVEPRVSQTDDGLILRFVVLERPIVQRVEYKGLKRVKQKVFDSLTQLKPGSPFDVGSNREAARRIEEYYHDKGYAFATVELEKGNSRRDREVVFVVNEGPKVQVSSVRLGTEKEFSDARAGAAAALRCQVAELTCDGIRRLYVAIRAQSAEEPVDRINSHNSRSDLMLIGSEKCESDRWHTFDVVVPDKCCAVLRLSLIQQNGESTSCEKNLTRGIHGIQLRVNPKPDAAGSTVSLTYDNEKSMALDVPCQFDELPADGSAIVQVTDSVTRIVERSRKDSKGSLRLEIEFRSTGAWDGWKDDTTFFNSQVAATVNGVPILNGDVLSRYAGWLDGVRSDMQKAASDPKMKGQIQKPEDYVKLRYQIIARDLPSYIQKKVLVERLKSGMKAEQWKLMESRIDELFENEIAKLKQEMEVNTKAELELALNQWGTTLKNIRDNFALDRLSQDCIHLKSDQLERIERADLIAYYESHPDAFKTTAQVNDHQVNDHQAAGRKPFKDVQQEIYKLIEDERKKDRYEKVLREAFANIVVESPHDIPRFSTDNIPTPDNIPRFTPDE